MKKGFIFRYILSLLLFITAFYPWTVFLMTSVNSKPIHPGLILFLLFIVTVFFILFQKRKYIVSYSAAGFIISLIIISSFYYSGSEAGFKLIYFFPVKTVTGIFNYLLLILFTFLIWAASFQLVSRIPDKAVLRIRFDFGIASFFFLLIIKLVIKIKGGDISVYESSADCFVFFLVCGFLALVIKSGPGEESVIKSAAAVLVFFTIVITFSSFIFYFFSPELKELAFSGSGMLGRAGSGFEKELALFIKFFLDFRYRRRVLDGTFNSHFSTAAGSSSGNVPDEVIYVFLVFILLLILSASVVIAYILIKVLIKSLKKNREGSNNVKADFGLFRIFIKKFLRIIYLNNFSAPELRYFRYLKIFGLIKGLKSFDFETPREYAERLSLRFTDFRYEIFLITEIHDDFLYGGIRADKLKVNTAYSALKKVINPVFHLKRKNKQAE